MAGIIHNRAKCLICGDILESESRHHFIQCQCGNLSIDGGKTYLKRSAINPEMVEDMSISCTNDECFDCWRDCPHKNP